MGPGPVHQALLGGLGPGPGPEMDRLHFRAILRCIRIPSVFPGRTCDWRREIGREEADT